MAWLGSGGFDSHGNYLMVGIFLRKKWEVFTWIVRIRTASITRKRKMRTISWDATCLVAVTARKDIVRSSSVGKEMENKMKKYPILEKNGAYIPFEMMLEHENQCYINHGQSVETLARRGGTDYIETFFILHDSKYANNARYGTEEYDKKVEVAKRYVLSMAYEWCMEHGLFDSEEE